MRLEGLIVTRDAELLNTMTDAFSHAGVDLRLREAFAGAVDIAARHHFDALAIDCDELPGGADLLLEVRKSRTNQQSVIFALVNGITSVAGALEQGADFVMAKPVDPGRLNSCLKLALPTMERAHRRAFRYPVDVRGEIVLPGRGATPARMLNVSEGGFAVKLADAADINDILLVRWPVPGITAAPLESKAIVAWSSSPHFGLQIVRMTDPTRAVLQSWLMTMELQRT